MMLPKHTFFEIVEDDKGNREFRGFMDVQGALRLGVGTSLHMTSAIKMECRHGQLYELLFDTKAGCPGQDEKTLPPPMDLYVGILPDEACLFMSIESAHKAGMTQVIQCNRMQFECPACHQLHYTVRTSAVRSSALRRSLMLYLTDLMIRTKFQPQAFIDELIEFLMIFSHYEEEVVGGEVEETEGEESKEKGSETLTDAEAQHTEPTDTEE